MAVNPNIVALEGLLRELEQLIATRHPALLALFLTFANEARFGRRWMVDDLRQLPAGASILEVGGGLMLLATSLCREGYSITVLEPIGTGFSAFLELQKIILEYAAITGCAPTVLSVRVEDFLPTLEQRRYDFSYSVNVMEHVDDVELALVNVAGALKDGARYRFTCPNYLFPYEPHFSIGTLFAKRLTWKVMNRLILNPRRLAEKGITDPMGLWASLNWISVPKLLQYAKQKPTWDLQFDKGLFSSTLSRLATDDQFASRHPGWVRYAARLLVGIGGLHVLQMIPARFLPIIDCSLVRQPLHADSAQGEAQWHR